MGSKPTPWGQTERTAAEDATSASEKSQKRGYRTCASAVEGEYTRCANEAWGHGAWSMEQSTWSNGHDTLCIDMHARAGDGDGLD